MNVACEWKHMHIVFPSPDSIQRFVGSPDVVAQLESLRSHREARRRIQILLVVTLRRALKDLFSRQGVVPAQPPGFSVPAAQRLPATRACANEGEGHAARGCGTG